MAQIYRTPVTITFVGPDGWDPADAARALGSILIEKCRDLLVMTDVDADNATTVTLEQLATEVQQDLVTGTGALV